MDQRTKLTKQIIRQSFFKLLKEKPVGKITVTKICEESGINRTTFYKYYLDVWDLLDQIESELAHEMNIFIQSIDKSDFEQSIVHILKAIRMYGDQYLLLASEHGDRNYIKDVLRKWYESNSDTISRMLPKIDGIKRIWLYDYITQGDTAIVIDWIEGGMTEKEETVAAFINKLNRSLIERTLKADL